MLLTAFLTATGFLAAISLVWGQLWASSYETYTMPESVYLGLIWTFLTVIVALIAFAIAGLYWYRNDKPTDFRVDGLPLGLLIAALIMTTVNVLQSIISLAIKLISEKVSASQPLMTLETPAAHVGAVVFLFLLTGIILFMSWAGTKRYWWWIA